jgi:hypothetical protein
MVKQMTSGNRGRIQRRINFLFESLSQQGEVAAPHIREFLNRMEDLIFRYQNHLKMNQMNLNTGVLAWFMALSILSNRLPFGLA